MRISDWSSDVCSSDLGMNTLAPACVGDADDRDLRDVGMRSDGVFDFGREDILAARDHHVLHPVANEEIAARVEIARVAGMDPAVGQRCGAFLGLVPIAEHPTRAAYPHPAGPAAGPGLAPPVPDPP